MIKIWELYPTIKNKTQRMLTRRALIDAKIMSGESEAGAQQRAGVGRMAILELP